MTSKKTGYFLGAIAGAGVMAAAVAGAGMRMPEARADQAMPGLTRTSLAPIFQPPPGAPMSFADIFDRVSPAVVSINVTSRATPRAVPGFQGFPFNIPRPDGEEGGGGQAPRGQPAQSSGSGFFISADGYVVTNNHVVENAESIKVVLKDDTELTATVIGRDEATDLAVLKVQGRGSFPFVNFENAAKPRVGDWVITVGNPFGLGGTATAGIVSAYGRDLDEAFVDYVQIDAAINRGNSGGPTFDVYGRVIGVNTMILSPSGASAGIGFAIPAETAEEIAKQLISGQPIQRGYIGASIQPFTTEMAEASGMTDQKGAIVADVTAGGPSQQGGLMVGDIVLSVNGVPVKSPTELTRQVARARAGQTIRLEVIRDGRRRNVDLRSGVRPSERDLASNENSRGGGPAPRGGPPAPAASPPILGMALSPLDETARARLNLGNVRGVVIESVDAASEAALKRVRRGDIITSANTRPVASPADVAAAVDAAKKAGRENLMVGIVRDGRTSYLTLKLAG